MLQGKLAMTGMLAAVGTIFTVLFEGWAKRASGGDVLGSRCVGWPACGHAAEELAHQQNMSATYAKGRIASPSELEPQLVFFLRERERESRHSRSEVVHAMKV